MLFDSLQNKWAHLDAWYQPKPRFDRLEIMRFFCSTRYISKMHFFMVIFLFINRPPKTILDRSLFDRCCCEIFRDFLKCFLKNSDWKAKADGFPPMQLCCADELLFFSFLYRISTSSVAVFSFFYFFVDLFLYEIQMKS